MSYGITYFIQPSELVGTNRYKIGCSTDTELKRCKGYKKGTKYISINYCKCPFTIEKELIRIFNEKFKLISGREFFEGDEKAMFNLYLQTILRVDDICEEETERKCKNDYEIKIKEEKKIQKKIIKEIKEQENVKRLKEKKQKEQERLKEIKEKEEEIKKKEQELKKKEQELKKKAGRKKKQDILLENIIIKYIVNDENMNSKFHNKDILLHLKDKYDISITSNKLTHILKSKEIGVYNRFSINGVQDRGFTHIKLVYPDCSEEYNTDLSLADTV